MALGLVNLLDLQVEHMVKALDGLEHVDLAIIFRLTVDKGQDNQRSVRGEGEVHEHVNL